MTFREKPITKLYAFAMAAVFALVLAGCGGGGGTAAAPDPEPPAMPEPTPQEMCEGDGGRYNADGSCTSAEDLAAEMAEAEALSGAQEAAMAAYMAAMAAVGGAKDPVAMANAQPYAGMAKEASDMAAAATTSEMAMEHQMAAEAARDMAMEAAGTRGLGLTTLANMITNQNDIDNAILEGTEPDDPVSNAGRVGTELAATAVHPGTGGAPPTDAEIAGLVTHTTVDDTGTPPNAPGGSVAQGGVASTTVEYRASGPRFTVALPAGTNAVRRGETPTSLTTRGGWMGAELVGSAPNTVGTTPPDGSMTYANVYTDIQAPAVDIRYADPASPSITNADLVTQLANDPEITGDIPSDGSSFVARYNSDPDDNNPPVPGMFSCPAAAATASPPGCSISVKDGVVESILGYVFLQQQRNPGSTSTPDTDYLAWGVWLHVPNNPAAAASAGAFASGNDAFEVRAALKGTATYNGVASGIYSAGGMVEYFDADVSLTANFGGTVGADSTPTTGTVGDNDGLLLGAVTGSVSNIKAGGMDVEGSLTLGRARVLSGTAAAASTIANAPSTSGFEGATSGTLAGRAMVGRWGGQFYGPNATESADDGTTYPTTAAGTFGADAPGNVNDPVRILGAFGAWKAE